MLIPSLSHDYSGRERSNIPLIALLLYLTHSATVRNPMAPTGTQKVFSLLENSRDNHIVLFSNAPHYCFDVLYGQSIFINSSIHTKVDFL